MIRVAVSGGFDPVHVGHIELFEKAKMLGDWLIVIVNSDEFLIRKKGLYMMPLGDRVRIIGALKTVDEVMPSTDKDMTVSQSLRKLRDIWPYERIIFANGGDRIEAVEEESKVCTELNIEQVFRLGDKIRSSSDYIKNAIQN